MSDLTTQNIKISGPAEACKRLIDQHIAQTTDDSAEVTDKNAREDLWSLLKALPKTEKVRLFIDPETVFPTPANLTEEEACQWQDDTWGSTGVECVKPKSVLISDTHCFIEMQYGSPGNGLNAVTEEIALRYPELDIELETINESGEYHEYGRAEAGDTEMQIELREVDLYNDEEDRQRIHDVFGWELEIPEDEEEEDAA